LKIEVGREGVRESNEKIEFTKVKYTHSGDTSRNLFEHCVLYYKTQTGYISDRSM
jgi:hypothetical protein